MNELPDYNPLAQARQELSDAELSRETTTASQVDDLEDPQSRVDGS
jgi:hypothetical protein